MPDGNHREWLDVDWWINRILSSARHTQLIGLHRIRSADQTLHLMSGIRLARRCSNIPGRGAKRRDRRFEDTVNFAEDGRG